VGGGGGVGVVVMVVVVVIIISVVVVVGVVEPLAYSSYKDYIYFICCLSDIPGIFCLCNKFK
jgi:hypothetical protein